MNSSSPSKNAWPNRAVARNAGTAAALLALLLVGCSDDDGWTAQRRYSMGTWVDTIHLRQSGQVETRLATEIDGKLRRYEVNYYAWADGELGRLNAAIANGETFEASEELTGLLLHAQALSSGSAGFFDPGVGAVVEAWGFHTADSEPGQPTVEFLELWASDPASIADLRIEGNRISSDDARLVLDLGGIAKGEVVDRLLESFIAAGVENVLINAGGDVRVRGDRGTRSWAIGIQSPRNLSGLLGSMDLYDGEAAFTSGDYERFFDAERGRRHHLLDPVSGLPATHTQAVTVIARDGALADAAATAIFVAGPARWQETAESLGIRHVLRVDGNGSIEMTPAMRERVRMQADHEPATMHATP